MRKSKGKFSLSFTNMLICQNYAKIISGVEQGERDKQDTEDTVIFFQYWGFNVGLHSTTPKLHPQALRHHLSRHSPGPASMGSMDEDLIKFCALDAMFVSHCSCP